MRYLPLFLVFILPLLAACDEGGSIGAFDSVTAVGDSEGELRYDVDADEYQLSGSGHNMWAAEDAFQYAWRRVEGDLTLTADVTWPKAVTSTAKRGGWCGAA